MNNMSKVWGPEAEHLWDELGKRSVLRAPPAALGKVVTGQGREAAVGCNISVNRGRGQAASERGSNATPHSNPSIRLGKKGPGSGVADADCG